MSTNHWHYLPKDLNEHELAILERRIAENALRGPEFIGQGLTERIGSDAYGYYIVASKQLGKKKIWGIAGADSVFHSSWYDGSMDCSINMDAATPSSWITTYGKHEDGTPKWWFCDANGKRFTGKQAKTKFYWNGASAYNNPSF